MVTLLLKKDFKLKSFVLETGLRLSFFQHLHLAVRYDEKNKLHFFFLCHKKNLSANCFTLHDANELFPSFFPVSFLTKEHGKNKIKIDGY
jgi:hypothetical protein